MDHFVVEKSGIYPCVCAGVVIVIIDPIVLEVCIPLSVLDEYGSYCLR